MADIVKLIYKGDTMSQGGGGGSTVNNVFTLESDSDLTTAQAILDCVKAGGAPVVKVPIQSSGTAYDLYYWNALREPTSAQKRITLYSYHLELKEASDWDPELTQGTDTHYHVIQHYKMIFYTGSMSGTPVATEVTNGSNQFAVSALYEG